MTFLAVGECTTEAVHVVALLWCYQYLWLAGVSLKRAFCFGCTCEWQSAGNGQVAAKCCLGLISMLAYV